MKNILYWFKPEKIMTTEEWLKNSACGAPPGVYRPNMSNKDMFKWKGKLIKGKLPRVEIRKTVAKTNGLEYPNLKTVHAQLLVIVSNSNIDGLIDCNVKISMNGTCGLSKTEFSELTQAVHEATEVLKLIQ